MMHKIHTLLDNLLVSIFSRDMGTEKQSLVRKFRLKLRYGLPQLGWPGMLAIGLLAVALPFYLATIRPLQTRLDLAQRSAIDAKEHGVDTTVNKRRGGDTPGEQLTEFYKFFPNEKQSPAWLERLAVVAEKNGLVLNDGEYKVTQDKIGPLMRYKIALPVQAKYPQIRKFIAALATEIPMIALENVQFERKDIVDSTVQAKIQLVLYLVQDL